MSNVLLAVLIVACQAGKVALNTHPAGQTKWTPAGHRSLSAATVVLFVLLALRIGFGAL